MKSKGKIAIILALLAGLVLPSFVLSNPTQSASITISSAVAATSASAVVISSSAAPSNTDGTNTNISSNATAFNGWSNKAGWTSTVSSSGAALTNAQASALVTAPQISLGPSCTGYSNVGVSATPLVTNGSKNSSNSGQTISACYRQPISWADAPGEYSATFTHTPAAAP